MQLTIQTGGEIKMKNSFQMSRRSIMVGGSALALTLSSRVAFGGTRIKAAGIYTQPVEQQWDSRIHIAMQAAQKRGDIEYLYSESVADNDYERVLRQYAEQGVPLIVGEAFGLERAARKVAKDYPDIAFLMGSTLVRRIPISRFSTTGSMNPAI